MNEQFRTFKEYESEALKYLYYFKLPDSFENIGIVINWLATADQKYTEGIGTREGFRFLYANYACKTIRRNKSKDRLRFLSSEVLDIYYKPCINVDIKELIEDSFLNTFEKYVLIEVFINKNRIKNIASNVNKSIQYVNFTKNNALAKLRKSENERKSISSTT